jgi:hypothetical protein
MPEQEIVKADARLRRWALWIGAIGGIVCLVAIALLPIWLKRMDRNQLVWAFRVVTWLISGPVALLGFWLLCLGIRIWREQRYPLHAMRVIRDTPLREGPATRRIAGAAMAGGVTLIALAVGAWLSGQGMLAVFGP